MAVEPFYQHVNSFETPPKCQPTTVQETSARSQEATNATNGIQKRWSRLHCENIGQASLILYIPWKGWALWGEQKQHLSVARATQWPKKTLLLFALRHKFLQTLTHAHDLA